MNITFIAFGTRGDVQPAIVLGKALAARGHRVRVLASVHYQTWIEGHGLEAAASTMDVQAVMESPDGQDWIEHGNNPVLQLRVMKKILTTGAWPMMTDAWAACHDAEVVVSSFTSDPYAVSISEKLNAKHISMPLQPPMLATRSGAATFYAPVPHRESWLNYAFGKFIVEPGGWQMYGADINRFRREALGLPPQTFAQNVAARRAMLTLVGYSRHVIPPAADWPANTHLTGYWFLDEQQHWQPPPELMRFIEAGEAPVCVGFSSMTGRHPEAMTRLLVEAIQQSGRRAILLAGWAGLGGSALPAHIFQLDAAPHDWLFPRMAAVVHHGGAGTLGASLRAGVPSIIVPHIADQIFWGARVAALGVGPRAIPRPQLTAAKLAAAIKQATTDPAMQQRAAALGEKIRAEDGVAEALRIIDDWVIE